MEAPKMHQLVMEWSWDRFPAGAAEKYSFLGSTFCSDSYFGIRSSPVLPQEHVKDPGHSAKCAGGRLQLITHASYLYLFEWRDIVNWCMFVWCAQNVHRHGSSFTWHQPCNNQIALSVHRFDWYWKTCYNFFLKFLRGVGRGMLSLIQNRVRHECSESARKQWIELYQIDQ